MSLDFTIINGFLKEGNVEPIHQLADNDLDTLINSRGVAGESYLHWFCCRSNFPARQVTLITKLLDKGFDPNIVDNDGATLLMWATQDNCERVVELLLAKGCDPNIRDKRGETAVHWACLAGSKKCLSIFVSHNIALDARSSFTGYTPFHAAVINGRKECVLMLLEKGADFNIKDKAGKTARDLAKENPIAFPPKEFLFESKAEMVLIARQLESEVENLKRKVLFYEQQLQQQNSNANVNTVTNEDQKETENKRA
eukprot:TRINITY_DN1077_c0_g1_i1.p1 TRINITY_DN1077_c0_g1~~TRINITY_DN1077_c0_g1_i1.p1  ORF type:complete len:255 (-),score=54.93 TRINITY_DN1077_c0_g1_i1:12-776(-)